MDQYFESPTQILGLNLKFKIVIKQLRQLSLENYEKVILFSTKFDYWFLFNFELINIKLFHILFLKVILGISLRVLFE